MPPVARRPRVVLVADGAPSVDSHPSASTTAGPLVTPTAVASATAPAPLVETAGPHSLGPVRNGPAASAGRRSRDGGGVGSSHSSRGSSGVKRKGGSCTADDSGETPGTGFDGNPGIAREQTPISAGNAARRRILDSGHVSVPDQSSEGPASPEHSDAVAGGGPPSELSLGNSGLSVRLQDQIVDFGCSVGALRSSAPDSRHDDVRETPLTVPSQSPSQLQAQDPTEAGTPPPLNMLSDESLPQRAHPGPDQPFQEPVQPVAMIGCWEQWPRWWIPPVTPHVPPSVSTCATRPTNPRMRLLQMTSRVQNVTLMILRWPWVRSHFWSCVMTARA
jgi:hypothetical protein